MDRKRLRQTRATRDRVGVKRLADSAANLFDDPTEQAHTEGDTNGKAKDRPKRVDNGRGIAKQIGEIERNTHGLSSFLLEVKSVSHCLKKNDEDRQNDY